MRRGDEQGKAAFLRFGLAYFREAHMQDMRTHVQRIVEVLPLSRAEAQGGVLQLAGRQERTDVACNCMVQPMQAEQYC